MTDNHSNDTGQISVAELLARNGQKVGSRSGGRRRRGATGGISVAELTGEIPVVGRADRRAAERKADAEESPDAPVAPATPKVEPVEPQTPKVEPPVLDTPKVELPVLDTPKVEPPVLDTPTPPSGFGAVSDDNANEMTRVTSFAPVESAAPAQSAPTAVQKPPAADQPTTVTESPKIESPTEIIRPSALPRRARAHLDTVAASASASASASSPVPVRSPDGPEPRLLSGPASDLRGTGTDDDAEPTDTIDAAEAHPGKPGRSDDDAAEGRDTKNRDAKNRDSKNTAKVGEVAKESAKKDPAKKGSKASAATKDPEGTRDAVDDSAETAPSGSGVRQWALLIGESVGAIVAGGLLFKGFERLWDMMPWVAFALALVVIVGLVAVVRILRRTDDITSQLIALAVGAFVAFGPLLFLLPNG